MTINETQDEIIRDFSILDGDLEMSVMYLMELGQKLPAMREEEKTEENIVKGCQSKVWLTASLTHERLFFTADSNTAITKGLVSMLIRVYNGHLPEEILSSELYFMQKIGMERFIGTQRSNGFAAMVKQMKLYALAFKTKSEIQA
ncbi:MAG: SufE family protein [Cyclobacteriaceae bacterium]|nr:SufE family protein [Cyclobacteriaceae bacterium]